MAGFLLRLSDRLFGLFDQRNGHGARGWFLAKRLSVRCERRRRAVDAGEVRGSFCLRRLAAAGRCAPLAGQIVLHKPAGAQPVPCRKKMPVPKKEGFP